jgi:hypothetical protein
MDEIDIHTEKPQTIHITFVSAKTVFEWPPGCFSRLKKSLGDISKAFVELKEEESPTFLAIMPDLRCGEK